MKKQTRIFTKLAAFALATLMLASLVPMTALAVPTGYSEGDLLLQMSSLDPNAVTKNPYGITVSLTPNVGAKRDPADSSRILSNSAATYGGIGINTDLPFGTDTAYTIEFYAKLNNPAQGSGMFFGFCDNVNWPYYGANYYVYASGAKVNTHSKWWANGYFKKGSTTDRYGIGTGCNVWTDKAGEDGFVRFTITFDGTYIAMSIDGTPLSTCHDLSRPGTTNFKAVKDFDVKTLCLEAGYTGVDNSAATKTTAGDLMVEIKDISIYSGVVDPETIPDPEFVTIKDANGKVLSSTMITDENGVTVDSFPEIVSLKQVLWKNEKTGALVKAPITCTEDTVIRAYEYGKNESNLIGVQYSEPKDGKQSIRFIGGIYNLEAVGVGMEMTVRFKGIDGSVTERLYRASGDSVYDAINATEGGTLKNVSASELGAIYLYGVVLEDVPTDIGQIDIDVKTFKEIGASKIRIYSVDRVKVSFKDGAVDKTLAPLS